MEEDWDLYKAKRVARLDQTNKNRLLNRTATDLPEEVLGEGSPSEDCGKNQSSNSIYMLRYLGSRFFCQLITSPFDL